MQKITLFVIAWMLAFNVFSQSILNQNAALDKSIELIKPDFIPARQISSSSASTISFLIDYYTANEFATDVPSVSYRYRMNMRYSFAQQDTAWQYCVVAFDSLYDWVNDIAYSYSTYPGVQVDSIFTTVGQENNSGIADTLRIKIVDVDAYGYPTNNVLWTQDKIIPPGSPLSSTNNWGTMTRVGWAPNISVPNKKFAVRLEYYGSKQDTLGFLAGYIPVQRSCFGDPNALVAALTLFSNVQTSSGTPFLANSFAYWTKFGGLYPSASGSDTYYDCNSNGTRELTIDGANYIQNILITAKVTLNTSATLINDLYPVLAEVSNSPNPARTNTIIKYGLTKESDVAISIYDIAGRLMMERKQVKQTAGNYSVNINLADYAKGMYVYTIATTHQQTTKKLVIE